MSQMDVQFFKPFVDGTLLTLATQCSVTAVPELPFVKGQKLQPDFAIAGVIGLTSAKFTGTITLCFPEQVFLAVMSKMLGEPFTTITQDLQDGAAELLNIIYGQAKRVLNEQGHAIQKAIPMVVRGERIRTTQLSDTPVAVLPFKTEFGEFQIEICSEAHL